MAPDPDEQIQEAGMPVILAIDDDHETASALERDLPRRFAADYHVLVERSPHGTIDQLERLRNEGVEVRFGTVPQVRR